MTPPVSPVYWPASIPGITHDLNGDMTQRRQASGATYPVSYDGEDRPTQFRGVNDDVSSVMQLGYNYEGLPAWRQGQTAALRYYLYDGLTPVRELDLSGNAVAVNTFGPDGLISRTTGTFAYRASAASGSGSGAGSGSADAPPLPPSLTSSAPASGPLVPLATSSVYYIFDERGNTAFRLNGSGAVL